MYLGAIEIRLENFNELIEQIGDRNRLPSMR